MNKKPLLLTILTVLFLLFASVMELSTTELLALPFTAFGGFLRELSLSGDVGNVAAIGLLVAVCSVPVGLWLCRRRWLADRLLLVLAAVLGYVLYFMVNPGLRPYTMQNVVGDAIYAGAVWSVLISWAVLRLLYSSGEILEGNIYRALGIFLTILSLQFLVDGVGLGLLRFRESLDALYEGNTMPGVRLGGSVFFLFLDYLAQVVEKGCLASILNKATDLLRELETDPYSEATVRAGNQLSRWCKNTLIGVTILDLALNLGQVLFAGHLHQLNLTVRIPVASLAIAFGVLALSRLLVAGKALKDDNDLFI